MSATDNTNLTDELNNLQITCTEVDVDVDICASRVPMKKMMCVHVVVRRVATSTFAINVRRQSIVMQGVKRSIDPNIRRSARSVSPNYMI